MSEPDHLFISRVRAITWAVIVTALSLYALYAFATGSPWPQYGIPAGTALLLALATTDPRRVR